MKPYYLATCLFYLMPFSFLTVEIGGARFRWLVLYARRVGRDLGSCATQIGRFSRVNTSSANTCSERSHVAVYDATDGRQTGDAMAITWYPPTNDIDWQFEFV